MESESERASTLFLSESISDDTDFYWETSLEIFAEGNAYVV